MTALTACSPGSPAPSPTAAGLPTAAGSLTPSSTATPSPSTLSAAATPSGVLTTEHAPAAETSTAPGPDASSPAPAPTAATPKFSLTDPTSPWVVVNKRRPLNPTTFAPADLVQPRVRLAISGEASMVNSTTAAAAEKMFAAAAADGVIMTLASGYRSYSTQVTTYNGYVNTDGRAAADTVSARPGYSEHQTGWAMDIGDGGGVCSFLPCFADQPAAVWAKANAYKFGFIVRYPAGMQAVTGYVHEAWHLRYVGTDVATAMATRGIATLEQYFGLPAAPGYL
ncbi:D-alanyl-D-alanine carboxypeptidase family protein [Arthrobacter sp. fls2-241-R2A-200]|uniref:M15 family metallopeptidase n=1 Tax=Arthrobacter sp. fls2-241-R2A-200 TaxID=3040281 RepID=UPI00254DA373|nr:D-alanyl-D-alanine carboxypeptidase family protein [Arthrobacter sp. fls2-241-R2A-200]